MMRFIFAASAFALALPFAPPAAAQVSTDDNFSQSGGPAGCWANRCEDEKPKAAVSTRWAVDAGYQWAYVRSNEDPTVIAIVSCGEMDDTAAAFSIGAAKNAGAAALRQVFGGSWLRDIPVTVTVSSRNPDRAFVTNAKQSTNGESLLGGRVIVFSGGGINRADVRALSSASTIKARIAGRTFTFSGAGSTRALGGLPCGR